MDLRGPALGILGLSLAVKLIAVAAMNLSSPAVLVAKDTRFTYRPIALDLLGGSGYVLHGSESEAARVAPVFPFYLAAVYAVAGPEAPTWLLGTFNAGLRAVVSMLVFLLASRILGPRAGWWAGVLHALDPWEAFWVSYVAKDAIAILGFVGACFAVQLAADSPRAHASLGAGLAVGLATLARYASLGLLACGVVLLALRSRQQPPARGLSTRKALCLALGTLVALLPWLLHTQRVFGQPILTPHFLGRYLYVSNGPGVDRQAVDAGYALAHPQTDYTHVVENMPVSATEREWAFAAGALDHFRAEPAAVARVLRGKLVGMWRPTFEGASFRNRLVLGLPYCLFMALASLGMVGALARGLPVGLPATVVAFYFVLHLLLFADIRFRSYLTPLLAPCAGWALERLIRRWRG